jgi:hypothetical protein
MLRQVLKKYALPVVLVAILSFSYSCEKDFKNIGVDLVDNNVFSGDKYVALIQGHSEDILQNKTNGLSYYLLGHYQDTRFGSLTASVAGQLTMPTTENPDFGENAAIDSVVVVIPYQSTLIGTQEVDDPNNPDSTINVNEYELDSTFTSGGGDFNFSIYELGTYLNTLDPTDPTRSKEYFNDESIATVGAALYSGLVTPNANDTVMYIKRHRYTDINLTEREYFDQDTITLSNEIPFLAVPIDKAIIKQKFQDNASSSDFASNDNFRHYFRGLMLEATENTGSNALLYLDTSEASMRIYYTESQIQEEGEEEDLDGDGVENEGEVIVPVSGSFVYSMSGLTVNLYERDYTGSTAEPYLTSPDIFNGDDKLFIHGAAGSDGIIHLFGEDANTNDVPDELETIRTNQMTNKWLINDAKLYVYIDQDNPVDYYPERLYLYEIEEGIKYQSYEMMNQGDTRVSGYLVNNDDDEPDYYLFHLTDYISEIINSDTEVAITDFGLKTYDPNDAPLSTTDTIMRQYNNYFKEVVLHGNTATAGDRKLKFEIYYTELNE